MTLEEKAKKYTYDNYEFLFQNEYSYISSEGFLKKSYLAGAKETKREAKKLIKEFMRITEMIEGFEPDYSELINKAEAFLKE